MSQTDWLQAILHDYGREPWDSAKAQSLIQKAIGAGERANGIKPPPRWYTDFLKPMDVAYASKDLSQVRRTSDEYYKAILTLVPKY